ncbi:MAG: hypothetical protein ACI93T_003120, partial [Porticoccaceae bacterium]
MATSPERKKWKTMAAEDRIAAVNTLLVLHPRFRDAVNLLKRCHEDSRRSAEPVCGALLGTSGVGKTTVIDHYRRSFPVEETETATRQRVLKVTLQPNAKPKGIAADILFALRDPAWSSGTVQTLTNRAVHLLEHCGVELIILDEFHHLFDSERSRVMTQAAQWLKVLIVNTRIPVVVSGMPEATYVLNAEHTERRFKDRLTFRCFNWRTQPGRREFCGMLKKLDDTNGTAGDFSEISAAANLAGMAAFIFVMRAGEKSNRGVAGLHGSLSFSLAGPFLEACAL